MTFSDLARLEANGRIKAQDAAIPADQSFAWSMIIEIPPSVNTYLKIGRNGQVYKTPQAKAYQDALAISAKRAGFKLVDGRISVLMILVADEGDIDADNVNKVVIDALQGVVTTNDAKVWRQSVERAERREGERPHIVLIMERFKESEIAKRR